MANDPEPPIPVIDPQPGDYAYVVFWRADPWPDGSERGVWETMPVRIVTPGSGRTTIEVSPTTPPDWMREPGETGFQGSNLRFVPAKSLFRTPGDAEYAAAQTPPRKS